MTGRTSAPSLKQACLAPMTVSVSPYIIRDLALVARSFPQGGKKEALRSLVAIYPLLQGK